LYKARAISPRLRSSIPIKKSKRKKFHASKIRKLCPTSFLESYSDKQPLFRLDVAQCFCGQLGDPEIPRQWFVRPGSFYAFGWEHGVYMM
jgi:hypothetical protein